MLKNDHACLRACAWTVASSSYDLILSLLLLCVLSLKLCMWQFYQRWSYDYWRCPGRMESSVTHAIIGLPLINAFSRTLTHVHYFPYQPRVSSPYVRTATVCEPRWQTTSPIRQVYSTPSLLQKIISTRTMSAKSQPPKTMLQKISATQPLLWMFLQRDLCCKVEEDI